VGEDEWWVGEEEVVSWVFVSLQLIASLIRFFMCCSMLFWLDGWTSWMAKAVASVAVSISFRLNLAVIMEVIVCFSSCQSNSTCSSKVVWVINPSTCSATANMNFCSSFHPLQVKMLFSSSSSSRVGSLGKNNLVNSAFTSLYSVSRKCS